MKINLKLSSILKKAGILAVSLAFVLASCSSGGGSSGGDDGNGGNGSNSGNGGNGGSSSVTYIYNKTASDTMTAATGGTGTAYVYITSDNSSNIIINAAGSSVTGLIGSSVFSLKLNGSDATT